MTAPNTPTPEVELEPVAWTTQAVLDDLKTKGYASLIASSKHALKFADSEAVALYDATTIAGLIAERDAHMMGAQYEADLRNLCEQRIKELEAFEVNAQKSLREMDQALGKQNVRVAELEKALSEAADMAYAERRKVIDAERSNKLLSERVAVLEIETWNNAIDECLKAIPDVEGDESPSHALLMYQVDIRSLRRALAAREAK